MEVSGMIVPPDDDVMMGSLGCNDRPSNGRRWIPQGGSI